MQGKIFIVGHKSVDYGFWENELYQPIQVGFAPDFLPLRDNTGDNIAHWNGVFAENTALYWVRHNSQMEPMDFIGICQYRRRIRFEEDFDFEGVLKDNFAIVPEPLTLARGTVRNQYCRCHSRQDFDEVADIVKKLRPEYSEAWDRVMDGNVLFYSQTFVMKTEDFIKYADFVFAVGREWLEQHHFERPEDVIAYAEKGIESGRRNSIRGLKYQVQIMGFIFERLLTFWLLKDQRPLKIVKWTKFEGV